MFWWNELEQIELLKPEVGNKVIQLVEIALAHGKIVYCFPIKSIFNEHDGLKILRNETEKSERNDEKPEERDENFLGEMHCKGSRDC